MIDRRRAGPRLALALSLLGAALLVSSRGTAPPSWAAEEPLDRWKALTLPDGNEKMLLRGVSAIGDRAWVVGYFNPRGETDEPRILRTEDGGANWLRASTNWDAYDRGVKSDKFFRTELNDVVFPRPEAGSGPKVGYAVGRVGYNPNPEPNDPPSDEACCRQAVLRTTDGGGSWRLIWSHHLPLPQTNTRLSRISCPTLRQCHAVGNPYQIWNTDSGFSTQSTEDPYGGNVRIAGEGTNLIELRGVAFPEGREQCPPITCSGWAVAGDGALIATTDSGKNWSPQVHPVPNGNGITDLNDVWAADGRHVWAVGGPTFGNRPEGDCDFFVKNPDLGEIRAPCPPPGTVFATTDGKNWRRQAVATTGALRAVTFAGRKKGWAVGSSGTILHTADGGVTWVPQIACKSGGVCTEGPGEVITEPLFDVHAAPDEAAGLVRVYAVGQRGTVLKLTSTYVPEPESSDAETPPPPPSGGQTGEESGEGHHVVGGGTSGAPATAAPSTVSSNSQTETISRRARGKGSRAAPQAPPRPAGDVSTPPPPQPHGEVAAAVPAAPAPFARLVPKPVEDVTEPARGSPVRVWLTGGGAALLLAAAYLTRRFELLGRRPSRSR